MLLIIVINVIITGPGRDGKRTLCRYILILPGFQLDQFVICFFFSRYKLIQIFVSLGSVVRFLCIIVLQFTRRIPVSM